MNWTYYLQGFAPMIVFVIVIGLQYLIFRIGYSRQERFDNPRNKWYKWPEIPRTKIIYLSEDKWWNEFIPWVKREFFKSGVNRWFKIKIKYFLRGWYGWDSDGAPAIFIRERYYSPKILHHEMGHIIQRQHAKWFVPGLMNPVWIFRWF